MTFFTMRQQTYWPYLTEGLSQAINERNATILHRNQQRFDKQTSTGGAAPEEPGEPTTEDSSRIRNSRYAFYAVHCTDYPDTGDEATWDSQAASFKETSPIYYNGYDAYINAFCHGWGHSSGAREPATVSASGSQPILVVGIHGDTNTPYSWAEALADQLEAGHLLSVDEAMHGAVGRNSCATQAISAFLVTGTVPKEGTVCQADPLPAAEDQGGSGQSGSGQDGQQGGSDPQKGSDQDDAKDGSDPKETTNPDDPKESPDPKGGSEPDDAKEDPGQDG